MILDVSRAIDEIAWGKRYILAEDSHGRERILLMDALSLQSRNWVNFIYDIELQKAIKSGLLTEREILDINIKDGAWDEDSFRAQAKDLKTFKEFVNKRVDEDTDKRSAQKILQALKKKEKEFAKLDDERSRILASSAEKYAIEQKIRAILFCIIRDENGEQIADSWNDFKYYADEKIIDIAISKYSSNSLKYNEKQIRYIARSSEWRNSWASCKDPKELFGKSILDLDDCQRALLYWSRLYDNVYDAYERPPEEIVNDDEKLDNWLKQQSEKNKNDVKQRFVKSKSSKLGSAKIKSHGEIGYVVNPALKDDLRRAKILGAAKNTETLESHEVYDMNSELGKKFLKIQRKRIKEAGVIEERDLRSDADSRRVIGSNDAIVSKKRGPRGTTRHVDKMLPGGTLKGRRE